MEALAEIEGMNLLRDREIKLLYTMVSDVVRSYEGAVYGLDAMEMTTGELAEALKAAGFEGIAEVSGFLGDSDRVKFAKYSPPDMDVDGLIDRARRIVAGQRTDIVEGESYAD